jgi:aromatic-L-amino-acid/L-tryptophan decarboxylase
VPAAGQVAKSNRLRRPRHDAAAVPARGFYLLPEPISPNRHPAHAAMPNPEQIPIPATGDMPAAELREYAHRVVDWAVDYLERVEEWPVLPRVRPGDVARSLSASPPDAPEGMDTILRDFEERILPGVTHWNHPGFMAYFGITGSGPGVLAETIAATLNVNAMLWRTGPSATELEERSLDWLRQMMGLPEVFRGHLQDTASTSTLVALAGAREAAGLGIREEGMSGRALPRLRVYCSDQAHSVVDKACITLGLGVQGVRRIPAAADFRLDPVALETAIEADLARGDRPLAVVATVGTTSSTAVDPVAQIAEVCRRHGLWLHVDAAYGGAAAVIPEMRWVMEGCEHADSLVVNPHKWLFVPVDCSALFLRDPAVVRRAFAFSLQILRYDEGEEATNLMEYGPALGRRFRALKLWMVLRYFGREGIVARLREHIRLAQRFAAWVAHQEEWEVLAPVNFSTVCFRFRPAGLAEPEVARLNERILARVNDSGKVFLSQTSLRGVFALRLAIGNLRTTERHVAGAWELLRAAAEGTEGVSS